MEQIKLPERTKKPRRYGITAIMDVGIPIAQLYGILSDYHDYIDIAKIGVGSAFVTPNLEKKLNLYKKFDVIPYFGGTLFEKFFHQNKLDSYLQYLKKYELEWIEISAGVIDIPLEERLCLIEKLKNDFVVVAEVGSKDAEKIVPPSQWIAEIEALLKAGCRFVITEGRNSGTAGLYRSSGEIRTGLVADIINLTDPKKLIFEAPTDQNQIFFINLIGPNVNLGNISPHSLLLLESQRCGLRYETFFIKTK